MNLKLPVTEERKLTKTKLESLAKKYSCIPAEHRPYYPELPQDGQGSGDDEEARVKKQKSKKKKPSGKKPGRPPVPKPIMKGQPTLSSFLSQRLPSQAVPPDDKEGDCDYPPTYPFPLARDDDCQGR
jgi:hypothetical protein